MSERATRRRVRWALAGGVGGLIGAAVESTNS
jgi:hypothetical protein